MTILFALSAAEIKEVKFSRQQNNHNFKNTIMTNVSQIAYIAHQFLPTVTHHRMDCLLCKCNLLIEAY